MKKYIAILTLNDNSNYGNRLQNYALQHILEPFGHVTTIQTAIFYPGEAGESTFRKKLRQIKNSLNEDIHTFIGFNRFQALKSSIDCRLGGKRHLAGLRMKKCVRFTEELVDNSVFTLSNRHGLQSRDGFIVSSLVIGSDQVWNYRLVNLDDLRLRLGLFSNAPQHIISYAASISTPSIPGTLIPEYRASMRRLSHISVREIQAKKLLDPLSDKNVKVVLDPTLMVDRTHWISLFNNFVDDGDRYVLTYFLGHPSPQQEELIQRYAKEHHCRIRRILDFADPETYVAGPRDFVELFAKAEYIFTDSYHACCFSIIFNKGFKVFNRAGYGKTNTMNSRMETLFTLFELNNTMSDDTSLYDIDYKRVNTLLAGYREQSKEWLNKAML